jgi:hypothetical protein
MCARPGQIDRARKTRDNQAGSFSRVMSLSRKDAVSLLSLVHLKRKGSSKVTLRADGKSGGWFWS